jgi:hypothetical protein
MNYFKAIILLFTMLLLQGCPSASVKVKNKTELKDFGHGRHEI